MLRSTETMKIWLPWIKKGEKNNTQNCPAPMAFPADLQHLPLSSLPATLLTPTLPNLPLSCHKMLINRSL
jgi:hypothetical protein